MALLCMLHADGPATLKNLRQAGCSSLEAVESMDEERLSRLLGATAAAARRFAREARHLRERLGQGLLDREETAVGANGGDPSRRAAATSASNADGPERPWPGQDVVEEALAAWRARDLAELEGEPFPPEKESAAMELLAAMSEVEAPPPAPESTPMLPGLTEIVEIPSGLAPGEIDGLDAERCRILTETGVRTMEELALADALELSRCSGLGYTDVWRLGALARRALAAPPGTSAPVPMQSGEMRPGEMGPAGSILSKVSPSEQPLREEPSILELEWNREIRPAPPPQRRPAADVPAPRAQPESAESSGGPFA